MTAVFKVHRTRFFDYKPSAIHCLTYNEDLKKLALSRSDGSIEIWSLADNFFLEKVLPFGELKSIEALLWCNNRLFSSGLHGLLVEYDLKTLGVKKTTSADSGAVWCLCLNESKNQLAAGTEDGCVTVFNVTNEGLEFHRTLDRQTDRILSLAWHEPEHVVVTGGIDDLRIWSLKSGHAIQRLTPGRSQTGQETLVWAVVVTRDFTIVSGDSRGKVCFWDGRHGTQTQVFTCNRADVLCLCLGANGSSVFASGVEPTVVQFEFVGAKKAKKRKHWIQTTVRSQHSHDVRALVCAENYLLSAGVDTKLIVNNVHEASKYSRKIQPFPHQILASVSAEKRLLMLQYTDRLEVWRLGASLENSESDGHILGLSEKCVKVVELTSRNNEHIVCAAMSACGTWLAYSDSRRLRIFRLNLQLKKDKTPLVHLKKVSRVHDEVLPAHRLCFTADSSQLILASCAATVQILQLNEDENVIEHIKTLDSEQEESIHLLSVSNDGRYFATANHASEIIIYDAQQLQELCRMPNYRRQPTAMSFHPTKALLVVIYSDNKICEYDVMCKAYTAWSRKFNEHVYDGWRTRSSKMLQIRYSDSNEQQLYLRDESLFCIIDQTQRFPDADERLDLTGDKASGHCFHFCSKYRFMLHMDVLSQNELVIVERTPSSLTELLPATLKVKKFGT